MFSAPPDDASDHQADGPSAWPAIGAAFFAWIMALLRTLIGRARQEGLNLDIVFAFTATLLIPSIVLIFWLQARRARRAGRIGGIQPAPARPRLRLVSSAPAPRVRRSA
jgi:hypothetical protein